MAKKKTKEQVYDEEIQPLMASIIEICGKHKIANVISFNIGDDLYCTTHSTGPECKTPEHFKKCVDILMTGR